MKDKFEYVGIDKLGRKVKVYFEDEPKVYNGTGTIPCTLHIDDYNILSFQLRLNSTDANEANEIWIIDLWGGKYDEPLQYRYGTILMTALFEYVTYLEQKSGIVIHEIYGDLTPDDKEAYITKTNGRRRLTNFYEDVIKYLPDDVNKNITVSFYKDNNKEPIGLSDIDKCCSFRYFLADKEEDI